VKAPGIVLVRVAWGTILVAVPRLPARIAIGRDVSSGRVLNIARLLGGRHLLQAAVTAIRPDPAVLLLGAATDALHGASGAALAVVDARWRRPAFLDAALAAAFTALGLASARRAARR